MQSFKLQKCVRVAGSVLNYTNSFGTLRGGLQGSFNAPYFNAQRSRRWQREPPGGSRFTGIPWNVISAGALFIPLLGLAAVAEPAHAEAAQPAKKEHSKDDALLFAPRMYRIPEDTPSIDAKRTQVIKLGVVDQFVRKGSLVRVKIHKEMNSVLVTNIDGELFCTGDSCPHFSAPLHEGVPTKRYTVACPWHDAEFDIKSGECTNGPCSKNIPTFPIWVDGDSVFAKLPIEPDFVENEQGKLSIRDPQNATAVAIVGAGCAAAAAVESLRLNGYTGRILLFGEEALPPYERTVISKAYNAQIEKLIFRTEKELEDILGVEFFKSTPIREVNFDDKTVTTASGDVHKYDKVLVATGLTPKRLQIPGSDLQNVITIRNWDDVQRLKSYASPGKYVVVIGSSFMGCESAASVSKSGAKVILLSQSDVPYKRSFGDRVGKGILAYMKEKKLFFQWRGPVSVTRIIGRHGVANGVELSTGEVIQADAVVMAVGSDPKLPALIGAPPLDPNGALETDAFLRVTKDVYAAGDVASVPYFVTGDRIRPEHWNTAYHAGRIAAINIVRSLKLDQKTPDAKPLMPFSQIPYFWTMLQGKSIKAAGHCPDPEKIIVEGDTAKLSFSAAMIKDEQLMGLVSSRNPRSPLAFAEGLRYSALPGALEYEVACLNADMLVQIATELVGRREKLEDEVVETVAKSR